MLMVASLYVLRLAGGGILSNIQVSVWLYIMVFSGALLFITGKRLSEKRNSNTRKVLLKYDKKTLDIFLKILSSISVGALLVYSIIQGPLHIPQTIIFLLAILRYLKLLKITELGESIGILFDKIILILFFIFISYTAFIIYIL